MFFRLVRWLRATSAYLDAVDPSSVPAGIPVIDLTEGRWRLFTGDEQVKMARLDELQALALDDLETVEVDTSLMEGDGLYFIGGAWRNRSNRVERSVEHPLTGATITMGAGAKAVQVEPAGTIAALTVVLPPSPDNWDVFELSASRAITALTVNGAGGASVNGGSFLMPANSGASWWYRMANATWYRRY